MINQVNIFKTGFGSTINHSFAERFLSKGFPPDGKAPPVYGNLNIVEDHNFHNVNLALHLVAHGVKKGTQTLTSS